MCESAMSTATSASQILMHCKSSQFKFLEANAKSERKPILNHESIGSYSMSSGGEGESQRATIGLKRRSRNDSESVDSPGDEFLSVDSPPCKKARLSPKRLFVDVANAAPIERLPTDMLLLLIRTGGLDHGSLVNLKKVTPLFKKLVDQAGEDWYREFLEREADRELVNFVWGLNLPPVLLMSFIRGSPGPSEMSGVFDLVDYISPDDGVIRFLGGTNLPPSLKEIFEEWLAADFKKFIHSQLRATQQ